jgi:carbon-monoxide dehydrogenase medium subunit
MAISHEFNYEKPDSLGAALALLAQYGTKAKILAGATDLAVQLKEGMVTPECLIDIKGLSELNTLVIRDGHLVMGANVTFQELVESGLVQRELLMLSESALTVASIGVRNRATIAGNICSAVPSLDSAPVLLVYDALIVVKSETGEREIKITDWFKAPRKTALGENELVYVIKIPIPKKKHRGVYVKLGRYRGEDLAQAGVGVLVTEPNEYKVAFNAVGPTPVRSAKLEALLRGKKLDDALLKQVRAEVPGEISPITDIRASKEYRIHMCQVMLERSLRAASDLLAGKPVDIEHLV